MAAKVIILLTMCGILAVLETGVKALACYNCSENVNCNDPFKSAYAELITCRHYCVKGKRKEDGKVWRTCDVYGDLWKMNDCQTGDTPYGYGDLCLCSTYKCNGVDTMRMPFLPLLIFAAILVVASKRLF
ncbi:uncharacterized protein LOC123545496 [Mercenaria mercenaria]|uniref:uncharacterized protein LOC123545496 n=1 Tax=Mercenaria mercenaria TaxID=6596 RepID=UPI001E1D2AEF|nr:uncharacterized protein LOC123545496 [Mercenaria mercenaria]